MTWASFSHVLGTWDSACMLTLHALQTEHIIGIINNLFINHHYYYCYSASDKIQCSLLLTLCQAYNYLPARMHHCSLAYIPWLAVLVVLTLSLFTNFTLYDHLLLSALSIICFMTCMSVCVYGSVSRGSAEPKGSVSARQGFHRWPVRK